MASSPSYAFSGSAGVGGNSAVNTGGGIAPATSSPYAFSGSAGVTPSGALPNNQTSNGMPGTYISDSSFANPAALAAGVKAGTVTGSLDAKGNYVAPATTSQNLQAQGTVSGLTPPPASTTTSPDTGNLLQMPGGKANKSVYDSTTGQQVSPSEKAYKAVVASRVPPPQSSADASATVTKATKDATPTPTPDVPPAVTSFLKSDTVAQQAKDLMDKFMPQATTDTLNQQIQTVNTDKTILARLNTQLMNVKNVMSGTADDLRAEITAAGGFATQSQIDALSVARNKTLQTQATQLIDQISSQNQVVANDTSLLTDEKDMAATAFNEQSSVYKMAQQNYTDSLNAAQNSLNSVIKAVGYSGLYQSLMATGDAQAVNHAEQVLGLSSGSLAAISSVPDPEAQLKAVQLAQAKADLANAPLKTEQLQASINASNASAASSAASTAKTNAETAFEKAHGGMTQTEYNTQQKSIEDHTATINSDVGKQVESLANHKTTWGAAYNAISSTYPDLQTSDIDKLLHAELYRNPNFGG